VPSESECAPTAPLREAGDFVVVPAEELAGDELLTKSFSSHALATANVCGLVPLLRSFCREPQDSLRRVELRQKVAERLAVISLEVAGTAAVLDCEEERADQIADYLLDVANTRIKNLTLVSVLLGALGTVVTGALALWNVDRRIYRSLGILFGLAVAAIGLNALRSGQADVHYTHRRNPLAELYRQPAHPEAFPAAVWSYLNRPGNRDGESESLRERLLDRWQRSGELGAKSQAERERLMNLLFGPGGAYRAGELHMRANFFDQLESYVNLMKHDVQHLAREFAEQG